MKAATWLLCLSCVFFYCPFFLLHSLAFFFSSLFCAPPILNRWERHLLNTHPRKCRSSHVTDPHFMSLFFFYFAFLLFFPPVTWRLSFSLLSIYLPTLIRGKWLLAVKSGTRCERGEKKKEGMKQLPREAVYTCERSGRMIHSLLPVSFLGDSKREKKKWSSQNNLCV